MRVIFTEERSTDPQSRTFPAKQILLAVLRFPSSCSFRERLYANQSCSSAQLSFNTRTRDVYLRNSPSIHVPEMCICATLLQYTYQRCSFAQLSFNTRTRDVYLRNSPSIHVPEMFIRATLLQYTCQICVFAQLSFYTRTTRDFCRIGMHSNRSSFSGVCGP